MSLWWLQPGWTDTRCSCCGSRIYPQGDPDWGMCEPCFTESLRQQYPEPEYPEEPEHQSQADEALRARAAIQNDTGEVA